MTREPIVIRLNEQELFEENARKVIEQIDALKPGLREELLQKKRAELTDEQRQALDTPRQQRTADQRSLAAEAEELTEVNFAEVAREITGPDRRQAVKLAVEAAKNKRMAKLVSRYRYIVNFDYWRLRAKMEQDDLTISARKLIYEGNQAFGEGDLTTARRKFDEGFATWRKVLDKFPEMLPNPIFGSEMMEVIKRYRYILGKLDGEFPKDFILQDIIDEHKEP
ncbi:MAG: hypothetical protein A2V70_06860 [Planctomycetes bacterium RBG_13_63_9]|nr:MAG: hypothetical protein A2V70_06860 [Planctomycetes bacterium RBG_13_63_9]